MAGQDAAPDAPASGSDEDARPRKSALSPALLARVFHQPSLIYFNAVAEHLSIREAARRLNVASSAVSRQIAHLEDALGLPLFEREARRLKLAPAGEILYRHTRRLAIPIETAISELDMLRGLRTGRVRIATIESVGLSFLPRLIAEFGKRHPRIHLDVAVTPASEVTARLAARRVDIGFGFISRTPPKIEVALRRDVRIGAIMSPDHPLASIPNLTIADCIGYPMAVAKPEISIREVIEPFLLRTVPALPPLVEADSIRMLVELARSGHYVSVMTPIGAEAEIASGALRFRRLEDPGLPLNRFALMVAASGNLGFAPAVFFEHAQHFLSTIELPGAV